MSESCSTFGLKRSSHGIDYQKLWLMLFLKRAVDRKYSFRLYTEVESFAGFDDIVFRYEQNGATVCRFIQVKHTRSKDKKIRVGSLLTKSGKFNLVKYFIAYLKIKGNKKFRGKMEDFVIVTNFGFDFENSPIQGRERKLRMMLSGENKGKEISVVRINTEDEFLDMGNGARYKLIDSGGNIAQYLKQNIGPIKAKLNKKTKRNEKERKEISNEEIYEGIKSFWMN